MLSLRSDLVFAMPFSNVLHLSFPDKIKATRLAGFQQMTIQPQEVLKLVSEGLSIADMNAVALDHGVQIGRRSLQLEVQPLLVQRRAHPRAHPLPVWRYALPAMGLE